MSKDASHDAEVLKRELVGLFEHIQRIRKEIAAIRRPGATEDEDHFSQMSDELDAIVASTENATNTIMENVEGIEELVNEVRPHVSDAEALGLLDRVPDKTAAIFEACAFQDITGQRITKVVNSLQFIENRVNALISMWGPEALTKVTPTTSQNDDKDEYKKYLHGPQLDGRGVSQADVDAMFDAAPATPKTKTPAPGKPAPSGKPKAGIPPPAKPSKPSTASAPSSSGPSSSAPAPSKPAPAPKPSPKEETEVGPALGQDDIDKLFG